MFYSIKFYILLLIVIIITCAHAVFSSFHQPRTHIKTIAITQMMAHESLDHVRKGIVDELAARGYHDGKNACILYRNAQGNLSLNMQIAQQFTAENPDIIIAIATPSAQSVARAIKNTTLPLVFASISDPIHANLVSNLSHPGKNITGTRNVSPLDKQLELMISILPKMKTIGVIINSSEENSVQLLKKLKEIAVTFHIHIETATALNTAMVQPATLSLIDHVDALLLLQDNTVASALPALLQAAEKNHIPVFSTYDDAVKKGALAGMAFDEYAIGRQTGQIVADILAGKNPGDIPVKDPEKIELSINMKTAKKLHMTLNHSLIQRATRIYP